VVALRAFWLIDVDMRAKFTSTTGALFLPMRTSSRDGYGCCLLTRNRVVDDEVW